VNITRENIIAIIQQVKQLDSPQDLRTDVKLTDQGLDSLDLFSVLLSVQETFSVHIPDDDVDGLTTIDALLAYLNAHLA